LPNQGPGQSSIIRINQYGTIIWNKSIAFNWWSAPAQGPDGTIYVNVQPFLGLPRIIALNPDTGVKFKQYEYEYEYFPFFNRQTCVAVRSDGKIVFGAGTTGYCLNPDLTLAWSIACPTGTLEGGIGIGPNNEIYTHSESRLYGISAAGVPLWAKPYSSNSMSPAIGADGIIYIGTDSGVSALDPSTGDPIWTGAESPASVPIIGNDSSIYVILQNQLSKFGS